MTARSPGRSFEYAPAWIVCPECHRMVALRRSDGRIRKHTYPSQGAVFTQHRCRMSEQEWKP